MRFLLPFTSSLVVLALGACDLFVVTCAEGARFGLTVTPIDAVSGLIVPSPVMIARDGAYVDTLEIRPEGHGVGALARAGTYHVTVEAPGYVAWQKEGVVVAPARCGILPVAIMASMDPMSL